MITATQPQPDVIAFMLRPAQTRAVAETRRVSIENLMAELPPASVRGRVLANRYLPEELSGLRAFSVCYRADDLALDETVEVEFFPRAAISSWSAVRRAVGTLAALGHPQIVELVGRGMLAGAWPFLVTEGLEARTLHELLAEAGPFGLGRALRLGVQCAKALAAAHGAGVHHAAFGLDQVLLTHPGTAREAVKVRGLGVASLVREWQPALLACPERYPYLSPEQIDGTGSDARSDVYSLGAALYELVTGRPPFVADTAALVLDQHLHHLPEPPSHRALSRQLSFRAFDKIVGRCLAKSPAARYPSAAALAADLARLEIAITRAPGAAVSPARSRARANAAGAPSLLTPHHPPPKSHVRLQHLPKVIVNER